LRHDCIDWFVFILILLAIRSKIIKEKNEEHIKDFSIAVPLEFQ